MSSIPDWLHDVTVEVTVWNGLDPLNAVTEAGEGDRMYFRFYADSGTGMWWAPPFVDTAPGPLHGKRRVAGGPLRIVTCASRPAKSGLEVATIVGYSQHAMELLDELMHRKVPSDGFGEITSIFMLVVQQTADGGIQVLRGLESGVGGFVPRLTDLRG